MGLQVQSEPTAEEHSKDVLYTIKKDPIVGRYMVASRDIEPGESIFSDDPVAVGKSTEIYTNITNQSIRIKKCSILCFLLSYQFIPNQVPIIHLSLYVLDA